MSSEPFCIGAALVSQLLKSPANDTCRAVGAWKANRAGLSVNVLFCVDVVCIFILSIFILVCGLSSQSFVIAPCIGSSLLSHRRVGFGSGGRDGRSHPPCTALGQETLTSTCWGLAFSFLARCTLRTPSLKSAVTLAGLASSGSEKLRPKLP